MNQNLRTGRDDAFLRRYDYGDRVVVAADLPVSDEAVDVDVVDETAIVVIERNGRVSESEFEVPAGDARAEVKNGVLTVVVDLERTGEAPGQAGTEGAIGTDDDSSELDENA